MKICQKCGTSQNEEMKFCFNCGNALTQQNLIAIQGQTLQTKQSDSPLSQNPFASGTQLLQVPEVKQSQKTDVQPPQAIPSELAKNNIWINVSASMNLILIILFLIQLIFAPLSYPLSEEDEDFETKYEELNNRYLALDTKNKNLQSDYSILETNQSELMRKLEFIEKINTGHLLESCYEDIKDDYHEKFDDFWWKIIHDREEVIEFAARLAEHDLGRLYWTNANERYSSFTGNNMAEVAFSKLSLVPDFIQIDENDNTTVKIKKILSFVTSWVHYEFDLNEKFLSPIETLTFRSGDCDDFAILTSALFELVGIQSGLTFVINDEGGKHAMSLLHLDDLGGYDHYYFQDLTDHGLEEGKWILIEPQSPIEGQHNEGWMEQWSGEYFIEIDKHL